MLRTIAPGALLLIVAAFGLYMALQSPIEPSGEPLASEQPASVRAASVFALSNNERTSEGVSQLSQNPLLMRAAQLKAEDMGKESYYAHVSPDGETPMHWLDLVGYKYLYVGENLTANIMNEESVVSAWMGSPGHRRNLLDPKFTQMGIGVAEGTYKGKDALFVVQMLATPKPVALPPKPKPKPTVVVKQIVPVAKPAAKPAPVTIRENKVVEGVKDLTKPILDPLIASSTTRIFSATGTDPIPLIISTSAIPVELRNFPSSTPEVAQLPAPEAMRAAGRNASRSWVESMSSFVQQMTAQISSFVRI